jgi:hypothetical protein
MANRSLEQMMAEEQKRVTRGTAGTGSKRAGLLDLVHPITNTPAKPGSTKPTVTSPAAGNAGTNSPKAVATLAAAQINKGYTPQASATQISTSSPTSGGGTAGEIGKTALKLFTSGLGVMPLISGLAGLFGSGGTTAPPPLVKYAMPRSIQVSAANSKAGGSVQFADYGQDGTARSYSGTSGGNRAVSGFEPVGQAAGQSTAATPATQVVVNVQAMDSRSFLDHSQEIAQAVREAMLNMHALNDVVSEL